MYLSGLLSYGLQTLQEAQDLLHNSVRLLLLGPVARAVDEPHALELRARLGTRLQRAGLLVIPPVLGARYENGGTLNLPAGEQVRVFLARRVRHGAVPVQAALEAGPPPLLDVHVEGVVGQPALAFLCILTPHHQVDGLGHGLGEGHDVVGHLCEFGGGPGMQGLWVVARPVGALDVPVAAQEGGEALGRGVPVQGGGGSGVVPLVVLPRLGQPGEFLLNVDGGRGLGGLAVEEVEGEPRVVLEGVRHGDDAVEEVRAHPRTHGGGDGAEVVADYALDCTVAQGVHEDYDVTDEVGQGEVGQAGVVPAGGAAVATLVEGHDVVTGVGQGGHDFSP